MDTMRISDTDRERTAERLRAAVGEGRLDLTAYEDRVRLAYASVTRADLDAVTADLPAPAGPRKPERRHAEQAEAWRAWRNVSVLLIAIWGATSLAAGHPIFFWPVFPVVTWAAVMLMHTAPRRTGTGAGARGCAR
jgi:hypothetical protein